MRSALYPGSFDPLTFGHLDLIERGTRLFDRLVVAVGDNPRKQALFTVEERMDMIRRHTARFPGVEVASFSGLVVDHCARTGVGNILRGLRTPSDFEFEFQMALTNRALRPEVEVVFVMPSAEWVFLSSSLIKEVVANGGDASRWLPADVLAAVAKRLQRDAPGA